MADIPDDVDLNWIARPLLALQEEVRALRSIGDAAMLQREIRDLREELRSVRITRKSTR